MLTSEQIEMILMDLLQDKPPRVKGKEADEMREELKKEIAFAEANGLVVEIPSEIPYIEPRVVKKKPAKK